MNTPLAKSWCLALAAVAGVAWTGLVATDALAFCLSGVRLPADAAVRYNPAGKVTSGQCISSSRMDSAVIGGIAPWRALYYAGTTTKRPNQRDGVNTIGWANLGSQTLGVTNYLSSGSQLSQHCGSNSFRPLYEADVRLTTYYRWTSSQGSCPCSAGAGFYLNAVAAHELGHVVGLCHTNTPSSLMYASFGVCQNKSKGSDESRGENALCY